MQDLRAIGRNRVFDKNNTSRSCHRFAKKPSFFGLSAQVLEYFRQLWHLDALGKTVTNYV
jgi:hypothetical protein